MELIRIGSLKNDDSLLHACAEYIRGTNGTEFFKSEIWKTFAVENPEYMAKVMCAL